MLWQPRGVLEVGKEGPAPSAPSQALQAGCVLAATLSTCEVWAQQGALLAPPLTPPQMPLKVISAPRAGQGPLDKQGKERGVYRCARRGPAVFFSSSLR